MARPNRKKKRRGVKQVFHRSILDFKEGGFDTLFTYDEWSGGGWEISSVLPLLTHLKSLLVPQGQILLDSSNLIYLFEEEEQEDWRNARDLLWRGGLWHWL